ncbi:MAG: YitT family protein [Clostridia bacterium]|nr:YitT family protein [Clostridia bacterium]
MVKKSRGLVVFGIYAGIVAAAVLLAFTYQLFVVENKFAPAGLNGIATMIQYKTGFSIGYMSLIINIPLCVLAYFLVDKRFAVRSLVFCFVYSGVFLVLQGTDMSAFQYNAQGHDTVFPAMLSGVLAGFVYGVCFKSNASTGGTDIVSKYISKKQPRMNFFYVTFIINAIVAVTSFFIYATEDGSGGYIYDYRPVCLCILYCFMSSFIGNYIIKGTKSAVKFTVITSHADEITTEIYETLKHGVTRINATGSYHHEEKAVLMCVVNKHQLVDFQKLLGKYDDTFAFSETVDQTYGNFKRIK